MTNSEMKRAIREMAEQLAEQVVKMIGTRTLRELSSLSSDHRSTPAARPAAKKSSAKASTAKPKAGAKSAKSSAKSAAKPAAKKSSKPASSGVRLTPTEVQATVLVALNSSKEFMRGQAIVDQLVYKPTTEMLGRVLRDLITRGLVVKRGLTRNSEYQITASGIEQANALAK
jgi:FKBP-type peptidyl-prolyl cis-trans isomerase